MKKTLVICFLSFISIYSQRYETGKGFDSVFSHYGVTGSFSLYNLKSNTYILWNESQFDSLYTPASTFKIPNSLFALETGVILDENEIIPWDSVVRWLPAWNRDHNLRDAFKNSTVWFYQELARRIGRERMQEFISAIGYGNQDISGALDSFWLNGVLKISPRGQITMLVNLYNNTLPFSQRTMDIVKKIMIREKTENYTLRAKTGWSTQEKRDIGWFVGFVERSDNVWFFACCIQAPDETIPDFTEIRLKITNEILRGMGILD